MSDQRSAVSGQPGSVFGAVPPIVINALPGQWIFDHGPDGCWYVRGIDCFISLQARPQYCDRGRWLANVHELPDAKPIDLDGADGWPRYYFDLERAKSELGDWMRKRGQWPATPVDYSSVPQSPFHLTVTEMFAFLGIDESGDEGVPAMPLGNLMFPMMGADVRRIESLRPIALQYAVATGRSLVLAKFSQRTDIDSISAGQSQFDAMVGGQTPPPPGVVVVQDGNVVAQGGPS